MFKSVLMHLSERALLKALVAGDYARAEGALARIERYEGRTRRVMHNLAVVRMGQGDFAAAEALFDRQVDEYGDSAELLRALAEAAYLGGDRDNAARRNATALADPDCPDRKQLELRAAICADSAAHARAMAGKRDIAQGLALMKQGDKDAAIAAFRRAVDADASDFVALNNLGALLMNHAGDYAGAARAFEQAMALSDQPVMRANLKAAQDSAAMKTA